MAVHRVVLILCAVLCVAAAAYGLPARIDEEGDVTNASESTHDAVLPAGDVTITVLYDNRAFSDGCEPAWGFSCLVTGTDRCILFDTGGDGRILLENMARLGVSADTVDTIVLSHAHWDHTGGVEEFLDRNADVTIVSPSGYCKKLRKAVPEPDRSIVPADGWLELCGGVYSTGELGRSIPEQSLVVRTDRGLVVITGCAHPGIIAILKTVRERFDEEILLVMGGFHLMTNGDDDLGDIVDDFRALRVAYAAPCHCSGDRAIEIFAGEYGDHFIAVGAGKRINPGVLE